MQLKAFCTGVRLVRDTHVCILYGLSLRTLCRAPTISCCWPVSITTRHLTRGIFLRFNF
uniref:Uncharacterized protein n=1 Tax=Zea mays TaxID=4577 RepID=B4FKT2_MAIZE|nr:unknown [Zea mays]